VQAVVLNITDAQAENCQNVAKMLRDQGFRAEFDGRNEKINAKIRDWALQKVPYIAVIGDKERAAGSVAVRARGNQDLGVMSVEAFAQLLTQSVVAKS
jgi:threonyl-tRNA synthetase